MEKQKPKDNNCEVQTHRQIEELATLSLVHKIANLPPAGRASDTVQNGMRIQQKFLSKDDLKMEEM